LGKVGTFMYACLYGLLHYSIEEVSHITPIPSVVDSE